MMARAPIDRASVATDSLRRELRCELERVANSAALRIQCMVRINMAESRAERLLQTGAATLMQAGLRRKQAAEETAGYQNDIQRGPPVCNPVFVWSSPLKLGGCRHVASISCDGEGCLNVELRGMASHVRRCAVQRSQWASLGFGELSALSDERRRRLCVRVCEHLRLLASPSGGELVFDLQPRRRRVADVSTSRRSAKSPMFSRGVKHGARSLLVVLRPTADARGLVVEAFDSAQHESFRIDLDARAWRAASGFGSLDSLSVTEQLALCGHVCDAVWITDGKLTVCLAASPQFSELVKIGSARLAVSVSFHEDSILIEAAPPASSSLARRCAVPRSQWASLGFCELAGLSEERRRRLCVRVCKQLRLLASPSGGELIFDARVKSYHGSAAEESTSRRSAKAPMLSRGVKHGVRSLLIVLRPTADARGLVVDAFDSAQRESFCTELDARARRAASGFGSLDSLSLTEQLALCGCVCDAVHITDAGSKLAVDFETGHAAGSSAS